MGSRGWADAEEGQGVLPNGGWKGQSKPGVLSGYKGGRAGRHDASRRPG